MLIIVIFPNIQTQVQMLEDILVKPDIYFISSACILRVSVAEIMNVLFLWPGALETVLPGSSGDGEVGPDEEGLDRLPGIE